MAVSREDVLRTAALARLNVPPERLDAVAAELGGILSHMDVLQKVDGSAVTSDRVDRMHLREDLVSPVSLVHSRETVAPLMRDGFFLVPRLQTHSDSRSSDE